MKIYIHLFYLFIICPSNLFSQGDGSFINGLTPGFYNSGFRYENKTDLSRTGLSPLDDTPQARKVPVYIWYPSVQNNSERMQFNEYVKLAAVDIGLKEKEKKDEWPNIPIPVQLDKGMDKENLKKLWATKTSSIKNGEPAEGKFPVIVLGQGLYYESPLSQFVLCEYLASHGFVVITSPLVGTYYRLVNINPNDVETQIRDMEFLLSVAANLPYADKEKIGVGGYDLGGISGLLFCMRHPEVRAFFSLDCSILYPHYTGLPNTHQNYNEELFTIPLMHLTQTRFVNYYRAQDNITSLYDRKKYGDSYLLLIPTSNHGDFTSYANFNITNPVPGYWGEVSTNSKVVSKIVCESALSFFQTYLLDKIESINNLKNSLEKFNQNNFEVTFEMKKGETPPPSKEYIVNAFIEKGVENTILEIEKYKKVYTDSLLFDENVLNWLGYHFLYWWGREAEAIELFKFITSIYPNSANAYDSLAEAFLVLGEEGQAIKNYEKSLELNPENQNAKDQLKVLKVQN